MTAKWLQFCRAHAESSHHHRSLHLLFPAPFAPANVILCDIVSSFRLSSVLSISLQCLSTSFVCAAVLLKPDAIPKGRLKSLQTSPAPAKKAQSVKEILLYLYSRGKVCWHCSKGLFNLLQSDRGSREPSVCNAAPQVWWRCYICIGMSAACSAPCLAARASHTTILGPCQHCRDGRREQVSVSPALPICFTLHWLIHHPYQAKQVCLNQWNLTPARRTLPLPLH